MILSKLHGLLSVLTILGVLGIAIVAWGEKPKDPCYGSGKAAILCVEEALTKARRNGIAACYPKKFAEFEHRYLAVRGSFYDCRFEDTKMLATTLRKEIEGISKMNAPPKLKVQTFDTGAVNIVAFDASYSQDPEGSPLWYDWDFGDGNKRFTDQSFIEHAYTAAGTYTATLTVFEKCTAPNVRIVKVTTSTKVVIPFAGPDATTIYFKTGEHEVADEESKVSAMAQKMKDDPNARVMLVGHTDSTGTEKGNEALSEKRAKAVKEALIKKGVDVSMGTKSL